jgi:hypothetical protein
MSQNYDNPAFKKLLKKLQEESWQLELIISGFAIFGLFTAYPTIAEQVDESGSSSQVYKFVIYLVAQISCGILLFNLLLHVLLRGLWIGTLGLRYVSGDIEYEELKYSEKFTSFLKKKVGSFDKYIATLENYCSIIFAISFLLIFYVLALTFTIIVIALIGNYIIGNESLPEWVRNAVGVPLMIFVVIGMLFCFIDFVTLGFLKKKKWISKIYFPVYWIFSLITLSFLYRPLVYNFLDHKFGRRLSFTLVPIYFLILLGTSLRYYDSNYLNVDIASSTISANNENYEDLLKANNKFIKNTFIQSKVISDNYVKIFIPYSENIEDRIFKQNEGLKPEKDIRGLGSEISINESIDFTKRDSLRKEYLKTFNTLYSVSVDSIEYNPEFIFARSLKNKLGFETYIGTDSLENGKHLLNVYRLVVKEKDTTKFVFAKIPFWYFKD